MEQLPELALIEVFECLLLCDRIRIRSVCKKWKTIIESLLSCRKELVLFYRTEARPLVWFHSDRPVNRLSSIKVNRKFKTSRDFEKLFKHIERLYIVCRLKDLHQKNLINFTNRFRHLRHLQVDTLNDPFRSIFPFALKIRFNLPNLESFCYNTTGQTELVHLDCPKLEKLSVLCHFVLDERCAFFKNSLKFLKVASFKCRPGFELPNLEVLFSNNILPFDISSCEKLREIQFFGEHRYFIHKDFISLSPPNPSDVMNGLFEQKSRLKRSELQIYFGGIRCVMGPEGIVVGRNAPQLQKSHLDLILGNSADFKPEHKTRDLDYEWGFDEKIAALSDEQAEQLARCLREVLLLRILSKELAPKFKILFRYVKIVYLEAEVRNQADLDRLSDLFPYLVQLQQKRMIGYSIYNTYQHPKKFPNDFGEGALNFRFLAKFKALQRLQTENWRISASELKEILKKCRSLEELHIYSTKLEELENEEIRTTLVVYQVLAFENEFRVASHETEYSVRDKKQIRDEPIPNETFCSAEELVDKLDKRGYLRKENGGFPLESHNVRLT